MTTQGSQPVALRATVHFVVPGEPVAWARSGQRVVRTPAGGSFVRHFDTADQRAAKEAVRLTAIAAGVRVPAAPDAIGLDVVASWLYPRSWSDAKIDRAISRLPSMAYLGEPKPTRPDTDNVAKLILDALHGVAYEDDGCVVVVRAAKVWRQRAETHVRIWPADAPPPFPDRWWERGADGRTANDRLQDMGLFR